MIVSLIAAVSRNGVIGKTGSLPWYIPADLKRFKALTTGHTVVMGRKTYGSIIRFLGKPLPDRTNIVITHAKNISPPGPLIAHSIEDALAMAKVDNEVFIIGGAQIYEQAFPYATRLYITQIEADVEGDVFFPVFNKSDWRETFREPHQKDDKSEYEYTFITLEKA